MRSGNRRFPATAMAVAIAIALLLLGCTSSPEPGAAPEPQAAANHGSEQSDADASVRPHVPSAEGYPELTPEEMGRRLLELADSLQWIDDLSQSRIEQRFGVELGSSPGTHLHSFTMHLPESGWHYALVYEDDPERAYPFENKSVAYELSNAGRDADPGAVCAPTMQAYADALKAMQFAPKAPADVAKAGLPPGYVYYSRRDVRVGIKAMPVSAASSRIGCVERVAVERDLDYCPIAPCFRNAPSP